MRKAAALRRLYEGIAREVDALSTAAMRDVMPALAEAEAELVRDIQALVTSHGGETWTAARWRRAVLQLRRARKAYAAAGGQIDRGLGRQGPRIAALSTSALERELAAMARRFGEEGPAVHLEAAQLAGGEAARVPRFPRSAARYAGLVWDDMRRQLRVGLLKGETVHETAERLIGNKGFQAAVRGATRGQPGSLPKRYRHWAERVVRTETMSAYNKHHAKEIGKLDERLGHLGIPVLQRWDAALDNRICPTCRALHGKLAAPGQSFPGGYMAPPAHPHCRCVLVAWVQP